MTPVEQVHARWRAEGIPLNPGASPESLWMLEIALETPLPADVREFYKAAGGMVDYETDKHLVSFWSIGRIIEERWRVEGADATGQRVIDIAFADVIFNSWSFNFRIRKSGLSLFAQCSGEEFGSLSELLDRYLRDSRSLCL